MRKSLFTGQSIFESIKKLHDEVQQLESACQELEHGTLPHDLLSQHLENKENELEKAENEKYEIQ